LIFDLDLEEEMGAGGGEVKDDEEEG